jgi:hypothetical protein
LLPVIPIALAACGVAAFLSAVVLLRRVPGYRVARILSSAPDVSIDEAVASATSGQRRYVRVRGRISSEEEFPDEQDRPLVFRWRRLEVAERPGGWTTVDEERVAVPFSIQERASSIAVDIDALAEGLVVLPREATGVAGEVPDRLPPGTPPEAAVRHRVDQVSAVEHATVAGVPVGAQSGGAMLTEGLGRPLILTTLELPEAMRLLSAGRRRTAVAVVALLGAAGTFFALAIASWLAGLTATS